MTTGVDFDIEFRVVRPTGEIAWVHAHASKVPDGGDAGLVGTLEDITSRRAAEHALQEAETLFRTVFESSPVGMALLDHDGCIVRANHALSELTGFSIDDLTTKVLNSLVEGTTAAAIADVVNKTSEDRRILRADGSIR